MKVTEYGSSPTAFALNNLSVFYFGGNKEHKTAKLAITSSAGVLFQHMLDKLVRI